MTQKYPILILSHNSKMWTETLSDVLWEYRITSCQITAEDTVKLNGKIVLVIDLSCGEFDTSTISHFSMCYPGVRVVACLKKQQVARMNEKELTTLSIHCIDYFTIPLPQQMLISLVGHQIGMIQLGKTNREIKKMKKQPNFIIGESHQIKRLKQHIHKVSQTDANVLLSGESGTGKELVARAIHENSLRSDNPFIAVNCGALNEQLIHSELFGHEKGAFTGAHQNRQGKIALANEGTLFLDEIGDLPMGQQANLLRFLQEGTIDVLGSNRTLKVNVKVISATHVDLERAVEQGTFRQDLYYRINVLRVNVPTLRERKSDIAMLAEYFKRHASNEYGIEEPELSHEAIELLLSYEWPGNVRELINIINRATLMCEEGVILPADLDISSPLVETDYCNSEPSQLRSALEANKGNIIETARSIGVSRATVYRMIERYDLKSFVDRTRS